MPLILEAKRTFKVVLETDKEKENRPYFEFKYLSGRKWKEVADEADAIDDSGSGRAAIDQLFKCLQLGLVGWGFMTDPVTDEPIDYDPERLDDIVTIKEAHELLAKFRNQDFEADDQKN